MSEAVLSVILFYPSALQGRRYLNLLIISNINIFSVDHNNIFDMAVCSKGIKKHLAYLPSAGRSDASFHRRSCWQVLPSLLVQFEVWRRDSATYLTIRESLGEGKIWRIKAMPRLPFFYEICDSLMKSFFVFMRGSIIYRKIFLKK